MAKEIRRLERVEYQRAWESYPNSKPFLEQDPLKRWKKQAERDEESYWRRKFGMMI